MNTTRFLNLIAGNVFGTQKTVAIPTAYYLGLSTTTPDASGGNVTEPEDSVYARIDLSDKLSAPTDGVISNNTNILFEESTISWGTITHYCIFDAVTGGNLLMYGALGTPRTVEADTVMVVKEGSLKLSVVNS